MGILQFAGDVQKNISNKTKNVSESNNLKKKIKYEQDRIQEIFLQIGEGFYNDKNGDHKEIIKLCKDVDDRKRRIKNMKVEANALKGIRICPKCNSKFDDTQEYCGHCGTKLIVYQGE